MDAVASEADHRREQCEIHRRREEDVREDVGYQRIHNDAKKGRGYSQCFQLHSFYDDGQKKSCAKEDRERDVIGEFFFFGEGYQPGSNERGHHVNYERMQKNDLPGSPAKQSKNDRLNEDNDRQTD